jgi:hypothetical protein
MTYVIISDKQLSSSSFSHVISAPIEKVDVADWLLKLSVAEYQRCCSPDHIFLRRGVHGGRQTDVDQCGDRRETPLVDASIERKAWSAKSLS